MSETEQDINAQDLVPVVADNRAYSFLGYNAETNTPILLKPPRILKGSGVPASGIPSGEEVLQNTLYINTTDNSFWARVNNNWINIIGNSGKDGWSAFEGLARVGDNVYVKWLDWVNGSGAKPEPPVGGVWKTAAGWGAFNEAISVGIFGGTGSGGAGFTRSEIDGIIADYNAANPQGGGGLTQAQAQQIASDTRATYDTPTRTISWVDNAGTRRNFTFPAPLTPTQQAAITALVSNGSRSEGRINELIAAWVAANPPDTTIADGSIGFGKLDNALQGRIGGIETAITALQNKQVVGASFDAQTDIFTLTLQDGTTHTATIALSAIEGGLDEAQINALIAPR